MRILDKATTKINILRDKPLRIILLVSVAIAIIFPAINFTVIYPAFTKSIISNAEDESVRIALYMASGLRERKEPLISASITGNISNNFENLVKSFRLMKLKVFSGSGETLYSTDPRDIGTINRRKYFQEVVAKGNTYAKVVRSDVRSLEDQILTVDVVETYVPIMRGNTFIGAFEIYYDITTRLKAVDRLIYRSSAVLFTVALGLMGVIIAISFKTAKSEEELRRAHGELEVRVEERTAELRSANEELEAFVFTVSHDLRSPIITLKGYSQALQEDYGEALDETAKEYLDHIQSGSTKLGAIVSNLLTLARAGMILGPLEVIDFSYLINDVLDDQAPLLEDRGVECEVTGGPFQFTCDPERFPIIFTNLVSNAVKYMGEQPSPRIEIGCEEYEHEFQFSVRDNGMGIDPQYHEKIFELFQTLSPGNGTGVGLALVKKIVNVHGGRVWVESAVGEGSTFYVTLPKQPV